MDKDKDEGRKLTIRVKSKKSQNMVIKGVSEKRKISDLMEELSALTDLPTNRMTLLMGYPPKRVSFSMNDNVESLGLELTDTIIVQASESSDLMNIADTNVVNTTRDEIPKEPKTLIDILQTKPISKSPSSKSPKQDRLKGMFSPLFSNDKEKQKESAESSSTECNISSLNEARKSSSTDKINITPPENISLLQSQIRLPGLLGGAGPENVSGGNEGSAQTNYPNVEINPEAAMFASESSGILLRRTVASDNSCLFRSLRFCLEGDDDPNDSANSLREIIAGVVASDQENFTEAFLGRKNDEYCTWIMNADSWGGGIELSILSEHYGIEISVVDIQSLCVSHFGEDKNYTQRIFLIYDSIHYDPLYLEPFIGGKIVTTFPTTDSDILSQAIELAREARASHQFTDLKNFQLVCEVCKQQILGQKEAQDHAAKTGHTSFNEIHD